MIGISNTISIGSRDNGINWSSYCTPQNVYATATLDDTVVLTWDSCSLAESYKIYYGTDGVTFGSSATSTTNIKSITGLTAGTKYYFYVVSVAAAVESNHSATKDATTFTAYYVRPVGGDYGDEDGSSYANAWDGFADIVWESLGAGKVLYICGTHNELLAVGASGSEAAHLVFRGDYTGDAGVIDGTDSIATTVAVSSKNYTEWRNLTILQATISCINFEGGTHWMYDCITSDSGDQNVEVNTSANVTLVRHETYNALDDGISMHSSAVVNVVDSKIHNNAMGIQSSGGSSLSITGGEIYSNGYDISTNCPTMISRTYINVTGLSFAGTISYCLIDAKDVVAAYSIISGGTKTINNCTIVGINTGRITVPNGATLTINNSIIYDLNLLAYVPGDGVLNINNSCLYSTTLIGVDSNIDPIAGDPKFVNFAGNDFTLAADSPCRGVGITGLGYTTDYAGNSVPATGVDVGCYQNS